MSKRWTTQRVINSWKFDGVRLASFGAVTELDSYLDLPPKRGENIVIPFQHGAHFVPKMFDQREITFGIEVISESIADLEQKFETLHALLNTTAQKYLSYLAHDGTTRQALAEVTSQLSPTREGDALVAKIAITFLLAEPFFRDSVLYEQTQEINSDPLTYILRNNGSAEELKAHIRLDGPLLNTVIHNLTTGSTLEYYYSIDAGHWVEIDCGNFTAIDDLGANKIGYILYTGTPTFMALASGDNTLSVNDGIATTGTVQFHFYPPYI